VETARSRLRLTGERDSGSELADEEEEGKDVSFENTRVRVRLADLAILVILVRG